MSTSMWRCGFPFGAMLRVVTARSPEPDAVRCGAVPKAAAAMHLAARLLPILPASVHRFASGTPNRRSILFAPADG
jgi:hypothetical protein